MRKMVLALSAALLGGPAFAAEKITVRGDYLEARNADVFTGPCFSNSEVFIVGDRAVMAWKIAEGSWNNIPLDGLSIVAAVRASNTFSEDQPHQAKSVLIVDEKATAEQREALVSMARHLAQGRLDQVTEIKTSMISLTVETMTAGHDSTSSKPSHHGMPQSPRASLWAPGLTEIVTRSLCELDHVCGNEVVAYQPLSEGVEVLPAYTIGHSFRGTGLNTTWSDPNARSSFVGHFAY